MPMSPNTRLCDASWPGQSSALPHAHLAERPVDENNPVEIHQFMLDITGRALDDGNFEMFATCFHLPHHIETFGGQTLLNTLHDLRLIFDNTRAQFEQAGITRRIRDCISASFHEQDTILATHMTRIIHGHQQMRDPVPSHSVLHRVDGVWKVARTASALEETDSPFDRLLTRNGQMLNFSRA